MHVDEFCVKLVYDTCTLMSSVLNLHVDKHAELYIALSLSRYRPVTAHGARSTVTTPFGPQRPSSSPVHALRTPRTPTSPHPPTLYPHPPTSGRLDTPRVDPGHFDTLSPRVLSKLLEDVQPRPFSASYGDRVFLTRLERTRARKDAREPKASLNDDLSTTSGIDSDGEVDDDDSDDDDDDDEDSSDSEKGGFEPSLEEIRRQMPLPQSLFRLRPERLDAIYVPEDKRDMRRFDFDAEKAEQPLYEFPCPLPASLSKISLRLCGREDREWRDYLPPSSPALGGEVKGLVDRLVEMEKYQIVTEDWEAKKLRGQRRRQEKLAGGRAGSGRVRDKRCCGLCLQAACVGDCPEKRVLPGRCDKCRQPLCTGACQDSRYEQRMRHARSSDSLVFEEPPPPPPPRSPSPRVLLVPAAAQRQADQRQPAGAGPAPLLPRHLLQRQGLQQAARPPAQVRRAHDLHPAQGLREAGD